MQRDHYQKDQEIKVWKVIRAKNQLKADIKKRNSILKSDNYILFIHKNKNKK